jgi:hypothetical protein
MELRKKNLSFVHDTNMATLREYKKRQINDAADQQNSTPASGAEKVKWRTGKWEVLHGQSDDPPVRALGPKRKLRKIQKIQ